MLCGVCPVVVLCVCDAILCSDVSFLPVNVVISTMTTPKEHDAVPSKQILLGFTHQHLRHRRCYRCCHHRKILLLCTHHHIQHHCLCIWWTMDRRLWLRSTETCGHTKWFATMLRYSYGFQHRILNRFKCCVHDCNCCVE